MPHLPEFFDPATHEGNLSRYAVPSLVVVHARSEGDAVEAAQAVLDDANVEGKAVGWSGDAEGLPAVLESCRWELQLLQAAESERTSG